MKKIRQFCVASVFILLLMTTSLAGDIQTPGIIQSPPPADLAGDPQTGQEIQNAQASVSGIALNLMQTMLLVL